MGHNASTNGHYSHHQGQSINTLSTRKSNASAESQVRKSAAGTTKNNNSLDEEFSDLILHQVVQQQQPKPSASNTLVQPMSQIQIQPQTSNPSYNQFSSGLIEDEFNEVNDGLVEEPASLSRNILPDNNYLEETNNNTNNTNTNNTNKEVINETHQYNTTETPENNDETIDHMDLDTPFTQDSDDIQEYEYPLSQTPTPDLSKVDFTKISSQMPASNTHSPKDANEREQQKSPSAPFLPPPPPTTTTTRMMSAASVARSAHSPSPNPDKHQHHQQQQQSYFPNLSQHNHNKSYLNNDQNIPKQGRNKQFKSNTHQEQFLIPIEIKWVNSNKEPINKISIIGSFSNWRDVIKLVPSQQHPNEYNTTINLPLGVHKLLYIINNEYRVSDQLPTATDQEGLFFNWFEVIDDTHLFNHSSNQPNHIGASTDYDANIISNPDLTAQSPRHQQPNAYTSSSYTTPRLAGKYEVEKIQEKSNELLQKISKEGSSQFEHVEYYEGNEDAMAYDHDNNDNDEGEAELKEKHKAQQQSSNYPYHQSDFSHSSQIQQQQQQQQTQGQQFSPYELSHSDSFISQVEKLEYSSEIPEMFVNYDYFKMKPADYELPEPPQLPPHLNNVLLNKISNSPNSASNSSNTLPGPPPLNSTMTQQGAGSSSISSSYNYKRPPLRRADSSYYASNKEAYHSAIPNHVILNHLMTTSIKNEVLTVACITRYSGKFVTQIMHSPADK
ncbi:hypothetical protein PVL30_003051 [Lodderomyces elongisporus]|uniref:uncharacterized protein n=1 Tax=Lodderomyces elongisporus TaxID=36914 RepID=UPI00291FAD70|nr:uncharacterized protein PVL30_003051 [Lodderomyces elongisporus]WLF79299.1 hypothetical protein PVL30_003051 [Lodderomyces elongisporus]